MSESLGKDQCERRAGPFRLSDTWHAPTLVLPPHEHEHACLHVVLEGCYRETAAGRSLPFGPGAALYKPAGMRHSNRFPECGARTLRIELDANLVEAIGVRARAALHPPHVGLGVVAGRMLAEMAAPDDLTPLALEGLGRELLAQVFRGPRSTGGRVHLAEDCAACLRARFREPIRLGELARELGCERTALSRAFRARFGTSMGEYVRGLRVTEVMRRLERGDAPLATIALEVGFADQSHCSRVFRRLAGMAPAAWSRTVAQGRPRPGWVGPREPLR